MRAFSYSLILLSLLAMFGCSDGGSSAPASNSAHPEGWIEQHGAAAKGTTPPYKDCVSCHGSDLRGASGVPSCYSTSVNGQACHAGGPEIPHALDGSYLKGSAHGPEAKRDLTACQACHGQPGGPGTNPRFNLGIGDAGGNGCESCHGVGLAHPSAWAGPNNTFHYSALSIQSSCTLCHGVALDGVGGVGVSCRGCHDSTTVFTLDCTFCHGYPPDGTPHSLIPLAVNHRNAATVAAHDVCVTCHGMKENFTGGYFMAVADYALFSKSTDTAGDHWDGWINMNGATGYDENTFGCAVVCHGNTAPFQLADSGLPVTLGNYGGVVVPHPIDSTFLNPANHGPAAKGLSAGFPHGLLDCQPCHATTATTPPRFDAGIAIAGGKGCEGCHNDRTAHPSAGGRDNAPWYDGTYRHADASEFNSQCALCHGAELGGVAGVSPGCTDCHVADPVEYRTGCVSCHHVPPSGAAPAGNVRPNRSGQHGLDGHDSLSCSNCHFGANFGTPSHFDFTAPANIQFDLAAPDTMNFDAVNSTCTGVCHGETHSTERWY